MDLSIVPLINTALTGVGILGGITTGIVAVKSLSKQMADVGDKIADISETLDEHGKEIVRLKTLEEIRGRVVPCPLTTQQQQREYPSEETRL